MTFQNEIVAGNVLIREAIQSENFAAGSAGWRIAANGDAEFNDVVVRGEVIAGTTTDYVRVTGTPVPEVEWVSSSLDVTDPARIGFQGVGDTRWQITGPSYSGSASSEISFDDGSLNVSGNTDLTLAATTGVARLNGATVQIGGAAPGTYAELDPNNGTFSTYGTDRGKGVLSYVNVTASTALGAGEAIGVTSDSTLFELGRAYRITLHYQGSGNTANDEVGFRIRRTNLAGNSIFDTLRTHRLNAASAIVNGESSQVVTNQTGANLTTVIVGTVYRAAGAGNVQWFANAANPTWIEIQDIGAASDYPGARAL
ncbi:hypothetical protein ABTY59_37395 [Streptomyces sp. NPDC096079]|uniref:hypothetical protein n=1 Tax=Streptomyces sp. NPDC096079 TaxID=3155820 RepID=UPI00331E172A